jgi:SAM-dependent methyltransferase
MWDALAPAWDSWGDWHARATARLTARMVDAAAPSAGETILELACGPTADAALEVDARLRGRCTVIASDVSPAMIDAAQRRARRRGARVSWKVLDAAAIEFADQSVDVVFCRWCYMLLPDPARALREAFRVLRTGGRLAFLVFARPQDNPFFMLPAGVLIERGLLEPPRPGEPSMFAMADRDGSLALVAEAGFTGATVTGLDLVYRLAGNKQLWAFISEMAGPIALTLATLDDETRAQIRAEVERRAAAFSDGDGYAFPGAALLFSATVPSDSVNH